MNNKWKLIIKLYRKNKLNSIISLKCLTNYKNSRGTTIDNGVIMNIGKNIIELFYIEYRTIYYKN